MVFTQIPYEFIFIAFIAELLQKDPKDLAMNQSDNFRAIQEDRYIVDRTIPATGYGKGCEYHCISTATLSISSALQCSTMYNQTCVSSHL